MDTNRKLMLILSNRIIQRQGRDREEVEKRRKRKEAIVYSRRSPRQQLVRLWISAVSRALVLANLFALLHPAIFVSEMRCTATCRMPASSVMRLTNRENALYTTRLSRSSTVYA